MGDFIRLIRDYPRGVTVLAIGLPCVVIAAVVQYYPADLDGSPPSNPVHSSPASATSSAPSTIETTTTPSPSFVPTMGPSSLPSTLTAAPSTSVFTPPTRTTTITATGTPSPRPTVS